MYSFASSVKEAVSNLQSAFNHEQYSLLGLKLVLNANKKENSWFLHIHILLAITLFLTENGTQIEKVSFYKYLGVWLDDKISFGGFNECLLKKLTTKLGLYFRQRKCFPYTARKLLAVHSYQC